METYILKLKDYGNVLETTYYKHKEKIIRFGHSSEEENKRCARSRAVSVIKEVVYANEFDYFFTLTIKDDSRFDIEKSINRIVDSINYYKKLAKNKGFDFRFIYVFELTEKGGVHLHGFFSGFFDLYINKYNHISSLYFDNIGFQNFLKASLVNSNYLIKYVLKSPTYIKTLYHRSRGLKKPKITLYHDYFDKFIDFDFNFKNIYAKKQTYLLQ